MALQAKEHKLQAIEKELRKKSETTVIIACACVYYFNCYPLIVEITCIL